MLWVFCSISFLIGIPAAWAYGKYVHYLVTDEAFKAGLWDGILILLGFVSTVTLWDLSGNNFVVFVVYILGNVIGTYLVVKHNEKRKKRKLV